MTAAPDDVEWEKLSSAKGLKMNISDATWNWYLLDAWPGMLLTAKAEIVERKVEFLLPLTWRRTKVDGREQPHGSPRLPGNFAFVSLPSRTRDDILLNEQAAALATLRGVRRIYRNASGQYSPVRRGQVDDLRLIEAQEHREAGKAHPKHVEPRFKPDALVRIVRHTHYEGYEGKIVFSVRGEATIAFENGMKADVPECDLVEIQAHAGRRAG